MTRASLFAAALSLAALACNGKTQSAVDGVAGGDSDPQASGGNGSGEAGAGGALGGAAGGAAGGAPGGTASGSAGDRPAAAGTGGSSGAEPGGAGRSAGGAVADEASLLIFSKTAEYRHDSIPAGIQGLTGLAAEHGWTATATEDAARFNDGDLANYDAVIFLSTTGDVLNAAEQAAFERFIRSGRGFIGIHAASDTEYDWDWYGQLVGAYFREHPPVQAADIVIEDAAAGAGLPSPWRRSDEWYAFRSNPRPNVQVLLTLDESSYSPGTSSMAGDHPIAWRHEHDGGRAFYTALGHTSESYAEPAFLAHVAAGIAWALGK